MLGFLNKVSSQYKHRKNLSTKFQLGNLARCSSYQEVSLIKETNEATKKNEQTCEDVCRQFGVIHAAIDHYKDQTGFDIHTLNYSFLVSVNLALIFL